MAEKFNWFTDQKEELDVLEAIFGDDLVVVSEPSLNSGNEDQGYELKVSILLQLPEGVDHLRIIVPEQRNNVEMFTRKMTSRGLFVNEEDETDIIYEVKNLTPLTLHIALPKDYPSRTPPDVSLNSLWLNSRGKSLIYSELSKIFNGAPILFEWINWLKESCLLFLNKNFTNLCLDDDVFFKDFLDIVDHDINEKKKDFEANEQNCTICFNELPGTEFLIFAQCQHYFCKDCVSYICELNVKEGTLSKLKCPKESCDADIPVSIIRSVLSKKLLDRWETLSLSHGLTAMPDVEYCPRCEEASVQDPGDIGRCFYCTFVSCILCRQSWHPHEPCMAHEDEHDDNRTENFNSNRKSQIYLSMTSKRCPKCRSFVTKISGCHHIKCTICDTSMCGICGMIISGCGHYFDNPKCNNKVESEAQIIGKVRKIETLLEEGNNVELYCECGALNYQLNSKSNHATCVSCFRNICFCCFQTFTERVSSHYYHNPFCVRSNNSRSSSN